MADQMKMNASRTYKMSTDFSTISDDTKYGVEQLRNTIFAAFDVWKGSAAQALAEEYNQHEKILIELYKEFMETSKKISDAANILTAADEATAQGVKQQLQGTP